MLQLQARERWQWRATLHFSTLNITGISRSGFLVSLSGHSLGKGSFLSAEKQSVYLIAPADWVRIKLDWIRSFLIIYSLLGEKKMDSFIFSWNSHEVKNKLPLPWCELGLPILIPSRITIRLIVPETFWVYFRARLKSEKILMVYIYKKFFTAGRMWYKVNFSVV